MRTPRLRSTPQHWLGRALAGVSGDRHQLVGEMGEDALGHLGRRQPQALLALFRGGVIHKHIRDADAQDGGLEAMVAPAMATAGLLQEKGVRATVVNARFLRPLDESLLLPLARRITRVVTMEEGALAGGFGGAVVEALSDHGVSATVLRIGIPDLLVDHATPEQSKESLGLTPPQMAQRILTHFADQLVRINGDPRQSPPQPVLRR